FRVEVDRSFQVANANARVVEAALHGGAIRAEREVLTPVLRRSWSLRSLHAGDSDLRSPPLGLGPRHGGVPTPPRLVLADAAVGGGSGGPQGVRRRLGR